MRIGVLGAAFLVLSLTGSIAEDVSLSEKKGPSIWSSRKFWETRLSQSELEDAKSSHKAERHVSMRGILLQLWILALGALHSR
jgi:hypothetical protein